MVYYYVGLSEFDLFIPSVSSNLARHPKILRRALQCESNPMVHAQHGDHKYL